MNHPPGPTPEWFGKPEPPRSTGSSLGAVLITALVTFVVTALLFGVAGVAVYGSLEAKNRMIAAQNEAQRAADEQRAAQQLARAELECAKKLERANENCSEALVPSHDEEEAVAGASSSAEAAAVIRAARGKFRACFNQVLRTSPDARGKVNLQLIVTPVGTVRDVQLLGSTLPPSMNTCLDETARALRFPPAFEEKTIKVPLTFVAQ